MVEIVTIILGISLAILATCMVNIGVALQKKGLMDGLPELDLQGGVSGLGSSFANYFRNKYWVIGFALGIVGWIPYVIAQGFVGIIIVQPLQNVGLIVMVICANRMLNEKITVVEIAAIGLLIFSTVLIALSEISSVYIDLSSFILPFLIFLLIIFLIVIMSVLIGKKLKQRNITALFKIIVAGLLFSLGGLFGNILAQAYVDASINIISLFGWAEVLFGVFWFDYAHLWVFLGFYGLIAFNFVGIVYQNNGMQKGKAVVLWPIQTSINLVVPIIVGFVVFNQTVLNLPLFLIAIILILIATLVLSRTQARVESNSDNILD